MPGLRAHRIALRLREPSSQEEPSLWRSSVLLLALVAYVNSSLRPELDVAQFVAHVAHDEVADYMRPQFYRYCSFWLTLENKGAAAAQYVSVRCGFSR